MDPIKSIADLKCDEIALGDEGCIYPCLHKRMIEWAIQCKMEKKNVRFITPMVPERHMEDLYAVICQLANIVPLKVTFNDYGFLHKCKKSIEEKMITPILGRILTRSMIDCNWTNVLLEQESEDMVQYLKEYSFVDQEKFFLLKNYKIKGLEINLHLDKIKNLYDTIRIPLTIYDNHLLSVGRLCFSARYQELNLSNCFEDDRCKAKLKFCVDKKWSKRNMCYEDPDENYLKHMEELYVQGNVVYSQLNLKSDENTNYIDSVIISSI